MRNEPLNEKKVRKTEVSRGVADVAHIDVDVNKDTTARSANAAGEYSEEFLVAKAAYPKRNGSQPWSRAWKAWRARLREGHTAKKMTEGVTRYAAHVEANGKAGSEFVLQAATFLGPVMVGGAEPERVE